MSDLLSVACPSCKVLNYYARPQVIRCASCCYDETIPAIVETILDENGEAVDSVILTPTQIIQRGCVFSVDDAGAASIVSNG